MQCETHKLKAAYAALTTTKQLPSMLYISHNISIPLDELEFSAIRAQGSGGQNVNKVSTAVHLRFDIKKSQLAEHCKAALLASNDTRISAEGIIVIKAQQFRSQTKNKEDAISRLRELIQKALHKPTKRIPTKPSKAAKARRMDGKSARAKTKQMRKKIDF